MQLQEVEYASENQHNFASQNLLGNELSSQIASFSSQLKAQWRPYFEFLIESATLADHILDR